MRKFTVIGLHPDADPDDYLVIAVFEGELHDIYELES